ncbi:MAG: hypothetical protein ACOYYS_10570 [Chloroflexota bacterium]
MKNKRFRANRLFDEHPGRSQDASALATAQDDAQIRRALHGLYAHMPPPAAGKQQLLKRVGQFSAIK